jgi:hypothetical protein
MLRLYQPILFKLFKLRDLECVTLGSEGCFEMMSVKRFEVSN